jgi:protein TonB
VPGDPGNWLGGRPAPAGLARRRGSATGLSVVVHALVILAAIVVLGRRADEPREAPRETPRVVFVQAVGPGGGGGGSPSPAPPRPLEIPQPRPQAVVPTASLTIDVPTPPPTLSAPVHTNDATVLQASGRSAIALGPLGGGGTGQGIGEGRGRGLGPGTGRGFGDGAYTEGGGASIPRLLFSPRPDYTADAMRAKIQGDVVLEVVVQADGRVGDVRIVKSLDAQFGLDQEAVRTSKRWRFQPAMLDGDPVPMVVQIILSFYLH